MKLLLVFYCSCLNHYFMGILLFLPSLLFSQNIGIGISTPAEKFHVAGNIKGDTVKSNVLKITPNAGSGKVLTSDASGNSSWQTSNAFAAGNIGFGVWGDCATNGNLTDFHPIADSGGVAGDWFGSSVSISGNFAIIGAFRDGIGSNIDQGSVSMYQFNGSNWVLMQKITDATGTAGDFFGNSVSIAGNVAIVGAYFDDAGANTDQGSVSFYQYNGSSWVLMQKLTDVTGAANDNFGISVSMSGNYAIVGAYQDDVGANLNQGSVSIYQYNGSSWVLMQKIIDPSGAGGDGFGNSVSIAGNYAIVGSYNDDFSTNTDQGSVSLYQFNGSNWVLMQKLTDATGAANDYFGYSVSISGNYAIVGAYLDDEGTNTNQGSASIYQYNGSNWVLMLKLIDVTGAADDRFGTSVTISGDYAIVGAQVDDIGAKSNQGSASIFLRVGNGWGKLQSVTDPLGNASDNFANAVSIDAATKRFLIGALGYANLTGKVVFGKVN